MNYKQHDENFYDDEKYNDFEAIFNPMETDRKARRKRKPKVKHVPKQSAENIIDELADSTDVETRFETTYKPSEFEAGWLYESLKPFYMTGMIADIMAQVKGGKEASVYRCEMHDDFGNELVAAKVYRPRMFRNLRNDKMYREGRAVLKASGKEVKGNDHRILRALGKKSAYGQEVSHTSWLMYEFTTMQTLYNAGASIPKPIHNTSNAILMEYIGDEHTAAPILNAVALEPDELEPIFDEVMRNVEIMLKHDIVHGDLSAYNILYWDGGIWFIDFPQVVNIHSNSNAYFIFKRDIERICDYFASQSLERDPNIIVAKLWKKYVNVRSADIEADMSRYEIEADDDYYDDEDEA